MPNNSHNDQTGLREAREDGRTRHFTQQDTDHGLFMNYTSPQAITNDFSGLSFLDDNFE